MSQGERARRPSSIISPEFSLSTKKKKKRIESRRENFSIFFLYVILRSILESYVANRRACVDVNSIDQLIYGSITSYEIYENYLDEKNVSEI